MQAEGTSEGHESHAFLELMKYISRTLLRFSLPPFDMIVIDTDSKFTLKVDCGGRVGCTMTLRTILTEDQITKQAVHQEDYINKRT